MRISEGVEMLNLWDDEELIASVNFKKIGRTEAGKLLKGLEKDINNIKATVHEMSTCVDVRADGTSIISFYWSRNDKWRYGIRTEEEALELAKAFAELYNNSNYVPKSNITEVSLEMECNGNVSMICGDEVIAEFSSLENARRFVNAKGYVENTRFDRYGLESSSPA